MKKKSAKKILGATLVLAAIASSQAAVFKKPKSFTLNDSRISDKSESDESVRDGSKTERTN